MTAAVADTNEIFTTNPYEGHPTLSQLESDVLWEYAKLSQHVKVVSPALAQPSLIPDLLTFVSSFLSHRNAMYALCPSLHVPCYT